MRIKILTIALNPSLDRTATVARLAIGREVRADDVRVVAGGKAVNVARALRRLGIDAGVFGVAAGDVGRRLESLLAGEGIPQEWIWSSDGETRTNLTVVDRASGEATRILEPGPAVTPVAVRQMRRAFLKKLGTLNAAIFTGSLPPGMSSEILAGMVRSAKRANVLTALDTSGAVLMAGLKVRPFLVKPNRLEAEEICGFRIRSLFAMKKALQYFAKRCNIVLISLGQEGLIASDTVRMFRARGPVINRGSTVGCGDAALAGFLAGFLKGDPFEDSLRLVAACGAANVGTDTPGAVSCRRIKEYLKKIKVERL